ncbi:hypothetical protein GCM10010428_74450 [Actinosynnema pretiosum subsp. pretiosum]
MVGRGCGRGEGGEEQGRGEGGAEEGAHGGLRGGERMGTAAMQAVPGPGWQEAFIGGMISTPLAGGGAA